MAFGNLAYASERREDRDEVHHHTRAADGLHRQLPLLIVNISPNGLMARCDGTIEPGTALTFRMPEADSLAAEVRWALGGRIGCEFAQAIPPAQYFRMLVALRR